MAYRIRYGPQKHKRRGVRGIFTALFFLLFLLVARIFFFDYLQMIYGWVFGEGMEAFLEDYWDLVGQNAH